MISWDLNAPLNASIPSPHNAVHFADTKIQPISCIIQLRYVRSQLTSALYETRRFPVERISTHARGERVSTPREKASWPVCFSLGHGLAWFTWTNQTRETPEPEHGGLGNPPIQDGRGSSQWKFANGGPGIQEPEILNYLPYRQKRPRTPAARVQQLNDRNASRVELPGKQQVATDGNH